MPKALPHSLHDVTIIPSGQARPLTVPDWQQYKLMSANTGLTPFPERERDWQLNSSPPYAHHPAAPCLLKKERRNGMGYQGR